MTFDGFKGRAKRLDDIDLPAIGHKIGVGEDEIHAVLDVEASGSGFDGQGRVKALYEPHIAYRQSSGAVREKLVKAGLAYPDWGQKPYPSDSYPRIIAAMAIDENVALRSTSWGLGQIMGFNCVAAGHATPQAMVVAFADDEENHLAAMVQFIVTNGLDDELRRHDWAGFARGYNGPGYAKHGYHTKLAAAYAKWSKIKDTPWGSGTVAPTVPAKPLDPVITAPPPRHFDNSWVPPDTVSPPTPAPTKPPSEAVFSWAALFASLLAAFKRSAT